MIQGLVNQTLVGYGIEVLDVGLSTTPSVKLAAADSLLRFPMSVNYLFPLFFAPCCFACFLNL